jgi:predicted acylesterase/phospholipase RssA
VSEAVRGSCSVPFMFAPAMLDGRPCVDGGMFDEAGIVALPGVPASKLVVNVVCSRRALLSSGLPDRFADCRVSH